MKEKMKGNAAQALSLGRDSIFVKRQACLKALAS